ncbi:MAG: FAD-dependent oxidoreductase [Phycisphaerae bacterium]
MSTEKRSLPTIEHEVDFCVVGGGMAGLTAAVAAARHGASVALLHDRPVLGGNASSECRVHICGADRHNALPNLRETGILEEIRLENLRRNPTRSWGVWDTVLHETLSAEPNLLPLLNCSVLDADMSGRRIKSVTGYQSTTETFHRVRARIFADCSGDGVLAPLTGAAFRIGREGRDEYDESLAPPQADSKTMGMSLLFQARKCDGPVPCIPPAWAYRFDNCEDLPYGPSGHEFWQMGYWWVELGGEYDQIRDTEALRDELLKIAWGVWDHIKNRCRRRDEAANWALEWMQFLPAKRESRRYVGEHVLTQNDLQSGGQFDDTVAYGGWTMDDHDPTGFWAVRSSRPATTHHKTPSPYGIPLRSLYARDVEDLLFAGRCHSATHLAMSSTRVMGTGCSMGQAIGTAAALASARGATPAEITGDVAEIQQLLLRDDCYLPGVVQSFSSLTVEAELSASAGDPSPLRDGVNRPVGDDTHAWTAAEGDWAAYTFGAARRVESATVVLDSALDEDLQMSHHRPVEWQRTTLPEQLPERFRIEVLSEGKWQPWAEITENARRMVRLPIGREVSGVRFVLDATRGADSSRVYAFYVH